MAENQKAVLIISRERYFSAVNVQVISSKEMVVKKISISFLNRYSSRLKLTVFEGALISTKNHFSDIFNFDKYFHFTRNSSLGYHLCKICSLK